VFSLALVASPGASATLMPGGVEGVLGATGTKGMDARRHQLAALLRLLQPSSSLLPYMPGAAAAPPPQVYGPETSMTQICAKAIEYIKSAA
jgi:hypothetical protein